MWPFKRKPKKRSQSPVLSGPSSSSYSGYTPSSPSRYSDDSYRRQSDDSYIVPLAMTALALSAQEPHTGLWFCGFVVCLVGLLVLQLVRLLLQFQ